MSKSAAEKLNNIIDTYSSIENNFQDLLEKIIQMFSGGDGEEER